MTIDIKPASAQQNGWEPKLFFNDKLVEGRILLWRGQEHEIRVEMPENFTGKIALTKEDSRDLALTASPEFGVLVDPVDKAYRWKVKSVDDNKRGNIVLVFSSPDMTGEWRHPCVVRSDNMGDDWGLMIYPQHIPAPNPLVLRFGAQFALIPLNKTGIDDDSGALQLRAGLIPHYVSVIKYGDNWRIAARSEDTRGRFELILEEDGIPNPLILPGVLLSQFLTDEGKITIGDEDVPPGGNVYFRDRPVRINFEPNPGSLVKEVPLFLMGRANLPLVPGDIRSFPEFGEKQVGTYAWEFTGSTRSGSFMLELLGGYATINHYYRVELPGKLLSPHLEDEVDVLIDGKQPVEDMKFIHGTSYLLQLRIKEGSPLEGHALQLHCANLEGVNPEDLKCEPGFDLPQTSNYEWLLTAVQGFGKFQLSLTGKGMDKAIDLPIFRLGREDISEFFEVRFDAKPFAFDQKALATRYGRHTITLMPRTGAPEGKVKLNWGTANPELGVEVTPPIGEAQTVDPILGASWSLACFGVDGEFSVKAELEGSPLPALEIPVSLEAGSYVMRFKYFGISQPYPPATVVGAELSPGEGWGVRPTVLVTTQEGVPVSGINVEFISPDHTVGIGTARDDGITVSSVPVRYFPEEERLIEFLARTTEPTGRVSMVRLLVKLIPAS